MTDKVKEEWISLHDSKDYDLYTSQQTLLDVQMKNI